MEEGTQVWLRAWLWETDSPELESCLHMLLAELPWAVADLQESYFPVCETEIKASQQVCGGSQLKCVVHGGHFVNISFYQENQD